VNENGMTKHERARDKNPRHSRTIAGSMFTAGLGVQVFRFP
jgi:hypothetical protein